MLYSLHRRDVRRAAASFPAPLTATEAPDGLQTACHSRQANGEDASPKQSVVAESELCVPRSPAVSALPNIGVSRVPRHVCRRMCGLGNSGSHHQRSCQNRRASQRSRHRGTQKPGRGCLVVDFHRLKNAAFHAGRRLGISQTRHQSLDSLVSISHRCASFPSVLSRSRALARDSSPRTADSLRPSTPAISTVLNSSRAESSNTCRSAFGNLSTSRRTA